MPEPIVVDDTVERWVLYPEDNAYLIASRIEPDEKGVRHCTPDVTEGWPNWSWRDAVQKANKLVEDLSIPWNELTVTDLDITDGNLIALSEKLARTSHYIVQTNNQLTRFLAVHAAVKELLEHAVDRILSQSDDTKGTVGTRRAAAISRDKRLRNMKIELIEATTAIKSLETTKESLDVLWKTTSRVVSTRMAEPLDR